jgi:NhaP-type Na+/H+ or K+/H+ antiporter
MLELAGIVILGILAQWVAWRLKLPAILPLILIGLLVGPISTLFTGDGSKIIQPIWTGEKGLFPGEGLYYFVSLAISIILFEGGLTLKRSEVTTVGPVITKLITLGTLVTFVVGGVAANLILGLNWQISFLFSSLIIVTGPTVITPILRNIPLKKDVSAVLKWEGILIDPIGALVAVLVFEFISVGEGQAYTKTAMVEFAKILLFGSTFGFAFAHALAFLIKKNYIPHYLLNVAALSVVLGMFVLSDSFAHESGLLAVVVMGMVMGNLDLPNLKELLYFKESLSVLLISILFIVLAANINLADLDLILNWDTLILFLVIVFVIRPLAVFLSAWGSNLKLNEKLFIGWVGPRGIAAWLDGLEHFGRPISLREIAQRGRLDAMVTGAAAVSANGVRFGKGHGYFDLEWGMFTEIGVAGEETSVIAVVHDVQVTANELEPGETDVLVDFIVTPTRALAVKRPQRSHGIQWARLAQERVDHMPPLQELQRIQRGI